MNNWQWLKEISICKDPNCSYIPPKLKSCFGPAEKLSSIWYAPHIRIQGKPESVSLFDTKGMPLYWWMFLETPVELAQNKLIKIGESLPKCPLGKPYEHINEAMPERGFDVGMSWHAAVGAFSGGRAGMPIAFLQYLFVLKQFYAMTMYLHI